MAQIDSVSNIHLVDNLFTIFSSFKEFFKEFFKEKCQKVFDVPLFMSYDETVTMRKTITKLIQTCKLASILKSNDLWRFIFRLFYGPIQFPKRIYHSLVRRRSLTYKQKETQRQQFKERRKSHDNQSKSLNCYFCNTELIRKGKPTKTIYLWMHDGQLSFRAPKNTNWGVYLRRKRRTNLQKNEFAIFNSGSSKRISKSMMKQTQNIFHLINPNLEYNEYNPGVKTICLECLNERLKYDYCQIKTYWILNYLNRSAPWPWQMRNEFKEHEEYQELQRMSKNTTIVIDGTEVFLSSNTIDFSTRRLLNDGYLNSESESETNESDECAQFYQEYDTLFSKIKK